MHKNSLVNLCVFLLHKSSRFFCCYYKSRRLKGRETDQISVRFRSHIQSGSSCQNRRPQPNNGAKNHLRCTTKLLLSPGTLLLGTTRSVSDHIIALLIFDLQWRIPGNKRYREIVLLCFGFSIKSKRLFTCLRFI